MAPPGYRTDNEGSDRRTGLPACRRPSPPEVRILAIPMRFPVPGEGRARSGNAKLAIP